MTRIQFALPLLLLIASFASPAPAIEKKKPAPAAAAKPPGLGLKDGDRIIFIGDSITHQCLYTQYVENFFYTRYPAMRLHFRNAGVGGDRAADALDRFDDDIAAFKPTIATVLLGMNDAGYRDFDRDAFSVYERDMIRLIDRLDGLKCRVILMSPTMFDHLAFEQMVAKDPARGKNKNPANYNGVLAYYGKWIQEIARKRGHQFVDLYGPLNAVTTQQRKLDPNFTLIQDAIHPGPDGQLVMAYSLLQQAGELGTILSTGVRLAEGQWKPLSPALVSGVAGEPGRSVSYTVQVKALPWTVGADAPLGYRLTRAGHTGTQESHVVVGLQAGRYDLCINGQVVGTFDERALGVHAEIEDDPDSPTHQQAMRVVALNKRRNDEAIHPLRDLYGQRKGKLRAAKTKGDLAEFDAWLPEFRAKQAELEKRAAAIEDEIYQANQVKPLQVEIRPSAAPAPKSARRRPAKAGA